MAWREILPALFQKGGKLVSAFGLLSVFGASDFRFKAAGGGDGEASRFGGGTRLQRTQQRIIH